jgi:hypothetical protein
MVDICRVLQSTLYMSVSPLIFPTGTLLPLGTYDRSTASMRVGLTIDDSGTLSIGDLGLASTELNRAHASFERTGDGSHVLIVASQ